MGKFIPKGLLGLGLCGSVNLALAFSNLIVFGDSLSDNGNFPESPNAYIKSSAPKVVSNTSTSFYVPFSNPVDLQSGNANPPLTQTQQQYHWPKLNPSFLAPQVPIQIDGKGQVRHYRSLSWTELFLNYAQQNKQTSSPQVIPSYLLMQQQVPHGSSINYAWGSALALPGCFDRYYHPFAHCDRQSVIQTRKQYMLKPTYNNRTKINVPGLPQQIDFFLQDLKAKRVNADSQTIYTFWIGGNDLINDYNRALKGHVGDMLSFLAGKPEGDTLNAIEHIMKKLPDNKRPKQVYFFNMMNPGLTPGYYHSDIATLANVLVSIYNYVARMRIYFYNLSHDTKVRIVPVYDWYREASHAKYFNAHLGDSCQVKGGDYSQASTIPSNNCQGFMYWNDVHPAVDMQKLTAYRFMKLLGLI